MLFLLRGVANRLIILQSSSENLFPKLVRISDPCVSSIEEINLFKREFLGFGNALISEGCLFRLYNASNSATHEKGKNGGDDTTTSPDEKYLGAEIRVSRPLKSASIAEETMAFTESTRYGVA